MRPPSKALIGMRIMGIKSMQVAEEPRTQRMMVIGVSRRDSVESESNNFQLLLHFPGVYERDTTYRLRISDMTEEKR